MDFINRAKLFESVCKIGSRVEGIRDLPFFELVKQDKRFNLRNEVSHAEKIHKTQTTLIGI